MARGSEEIEGERRLNHFEFGGFDFDGGGLADEIEPEEDDVHAVTFFHPALDAAQGAAADFDARAFADGGSEADFEVGLEGEHDFGELPGEEFLVMDVEEIGDVVAVEDEVPLIGRHLEEEIAGEERLLENDGFAAVFVGGTIGGEGDGERLAFAMLREFLLAARFGMGDVPERRTHAPACGLGSDESTKKKAIKIREKAGIRHLICFHRAGI